MSSTVDDATRHEILTFLDHYYDRLSARDWPAFSEFFWPDATLTTIWQPVGEAKARVVTSTVPEFVAQAPNGPNSKPVFEERMTGAEVQAYSNLAQVWSHYTLHFGDHGAVGTWHGIDAFILMKHNGQWKIVGLSYTVEQ